MRREVMADLTTPPGLVTADDLPRSRLWPAAQDDLPSPY